MSDHCWSPPGLCSRPRFIQLHHWPLDECSVRLLSRCSARGLPTWTAPTTRYLLVGLEGALLCSTRKWQDLGCTSTKMHVGDGPDPSPIIIGSDPIEYATSYQKFPTPATSSRRSTRRGLSASVMREVICLDAPSYKFTTLPSCMRYYKVQRRGLSARTSPSASMVSSLAPSGLLKGCKPDILRTIARCHVRWLDHVLRRPDDHATGAIYKFDPISADWRQITQQLEGRRQLEPTANHSSSGGCSDALPRPWELKGQGSSREPNAFMPWDLAAAAASLSLSFHILSYYVHQSFGMLLLFRTYCKITFSILQNSNELKKTYFIYDFISYRSVFPTVSITLRMHR